MGQFPSISLAAMTSILTLITVSFISTFVTADFDFDFNFDSEVGDFNSANFFQFDRNPRNFLFASEKPKNQAPSSSFSSSFTLSPINDLERSFDTISPIDDIERAFDISQQIKNLPFNVPQALTSTLASTSIEDTTIYPFEEDEQKVEEKSVFYEPFLILNVKENELETEVNVTTKSPDEETKSGIGHGGNLDYTGDEDVQTEESVNGDEFLKGGLNIFGGDSQVPTKEPGPYGAASPNFNCEKETETLFVTESSMSSESKCFTMFTVECQEIFQSGKEIGSRKECNQFTETKCRTVYDSHMEESCSTKLKKQCEEVLSTVSDWTYEQKCSTQYEQQCKIQGYGEECNQVPKEICKQVPKKIEKQIPESKCKYVPERKCEEIPVHKPRKECKDFPRTVCTEDAIQVTKQVPTKVCEAKPLNKCITIPRQINTDVPKTIEKKLCSSTKSTNTVTPDAGLSPTYENGFVPLYKEGDIPINL